MAIKTSLGALRYNNRMGKLWDKARQLEAERIARGETPNPNLTDSRGHSAREALVLAEVALGENLVWLGDQLDQQVRQKDPETLRRLKQLNDAWTTVVKALNSKEEN